MDRRNCPYPVNITPKELPVLSHDSRFPSKLPYSESFISQGPQFFYTCIKSVTNYAIAVENHKFDEHFQNQSKRQTVRVKADKYRQQQLRQEQGLGSPVASRDTKTKGSFLSSAISAVKNKF